MTYRAFLQIGIYAILIVGYALFGMLVTYLIFNNLKLRFERKRILQNGVLVEGCIIGHRRALAFGNPFRFDYYLTYSYEYQGTSYTHEKFVKNEQTYLAYHDRRKISVCCMPYDPAKAYPVNF